MPAEQLTVSDALTGLDLSLHEVRRKLTTLSSRVRDARPGNAALFKELRPIALTLPQLKQSLADSARVPDVSIHQARVILTCTVLKIAALESFIEDLLAASDKHARAFEKGMLEGCDGKLRSLANSLQDYKMSMLLLAQLLQRSPQEPQSVVQRRRNSAEQRLRDILTANPELAARISGAQKYCGEHPLVFSAPTTTSYSQYITASHDPVSDEKSKGVWRSLLRPKSAFQRTVPSTRPQRPFSVLTGSSKSSKGTMSSTSSKTSASSMSSTSSAGELKLPISADELANGHHYINIKTQMSSKLSVFATQSMNRISAASSPSRRAARRPPPPPYKPSPLSLGRLEDIMKPQQPARPAKTLSDSRLPQPKNNVYWRASFTSTVTGNSFVHKCGFPDVELGRYTQSTLDKLS